MIGSSTLENVVAFQNVRKFATSRLITPVIAAGSSLRIVAHSASSPVSSTNTSSSEAARRIASGGTAPSCARSAPTIAIAGPAGRTRRPCASAFARTSASRSGGA